MSKKLFNISTLLALGLIASCGINHKSSKKSDSKDGNNSTLEESYSYEYDLSSCSTGKQKFDSKEAFCKGLQDHEKNNYCAYSIRAEQFKRQNCPGNF